MARLLAIQKPDGGGIRPIAIGETLARLVGRSMVVQLRDALKEHLMPLQFGIAVPGGTEAVVLGIRAALQAHPDWVVLKVDVSNAFNTCTGHASLRHCWREARSSEASFPS